MSSAAVSAPVDPAVLVRDLFAAGVRYAVGSWTDMAGTPKSKIVPIDQLPRMFEGSMRYVPLGMNAESGMRAGVHEVIGIPDISTLKVLPWDQRFVWMAADLYQEDGEPFFLCPRSILKRQIREAHDMGYFCELGIEPEFYVFSKEALASGRLESLSTSSVRESAYDVGASMDAMGFLDRVHTYMSQLDFGVYSFDSEGGQGQYEFNFAHSDVLKSADQMILFRLLVRQAATESGVIATFMPKPTTDLYGSGSHFNMSLGHRSTGENAFRSIVSGPDWSKEAFHFAGGILAHARALSAVTNPIPNSYRRLVPRLANGDFSWAPTSISYDHDNRSSMLRLPGSRPAIENRAVDSAAHPHLAAAFMLAAGLAGIREGIDVGDLQDAALYMVTPNSQALPRTLSEALDAFESDPLVPTVFSSEFVRDYTDMKRREWEVSNAAVSDAERAAYLDSL